MLRQAKALKQATVFATDREIGTVSDVFFDDTTWVVRYFVIDTGSWLTGRQVLISPRSIASVDWDVPEVRLTLNSKQVETSPDIDSHMSVSRQHEIQLSRYYNWPYYWGGVGLWGAGDYPMMLAAIPPAESVMKDGEFPELDNQDRHLWSIDEMRGYHIHATDGELGHALDAILDDRTWAIQQLIVDTRNWWPGKHVLIAPTDVSRISWSERSVHVLLTRDGLRAHPNSIPNVFRPRNPADYYSSRSGRASIAAAPSGA